MNNEINGAILIVLLVILFFIVLGIFQMISVLHNNNDHLIRYLHTMNENISSVGVRKNAKKKESAQTQQRSDTFVHNSIPLPDWLDNQWYSNTTTVTVPEKQIREIIRDEIESTYVWSKKEKQKRTEDD